MIRRLVIAGCSAMLLIAVAAAVHGERVKPRRMTMARVEQKSSPAQQATYEIPWRSVNSGGRAAISTNYSVNGTVGQSAIGHVTSVNYDLNELLATAHPPTGFS